MHIEDFLDKSKISFLRKGSFVKKNMDKDRGRLYILDYTSFCGATYRGM